VRVEHHERFCSVEDGDHYPESMACGSNNWPLSSTRTFAGSQVTDPTASRLRRVATAVVVVLAVGASALVIVALRGRPATAPEGPLAPTRMGTSTTQLGIDSGIEESFGVDLPSYRGDASAIFDRVVPPFTDTWFTRVGLQNPGG
jgi:hypothetical protein